MIGRKPWKRKTLASVAGGRNWYIPRLELRSEKSRKISKLKIYKPKRLHAGFPLCSGPIIPELYVYWCWWYYMETLRWEISTRFSTLLRWWWSLFSSLHSQWRGGCLFWGNSLFTLPKSLFWYVNVLGFCVSVIPTSYKQQRIQVHPHVKYMRVTHITILLTLWRGIPSNLL